MAHKRPRPPSRAGRKARRGIRPSGAAFAEERLRCAPDRMVMCFRVCRRLGRQHGAEQGAAQKRSSCQAHCKSGSCGSSASSGNGLRAPKCPAERRPRRNCRRAFCLRWRQPQQVPQRQKALLRAHGDDIQVIQESSEKLSWPELLGGRHQRRVLRKGKQGGSQRVALLTAIAL